MLHAGVRVEEHLRRQVFIGFDGLVTVLGLQGVRALGLLIGF